MGGRTGIILQARIASSRLPRKALEPVGGRTLLEQCLRRLIASDVGPVVLATTDRPEDAALETLASRIGVPVFRGDTDDVLNRFVRCADTFGFDRVVRATGDNPAVDMRAPARLLAALRDDVDYVREEGIPYGAGVEAVTTGTLRRAARLAQDPFDREHVTPFIYRRPGFFRVVVLQAPPPLYRPDVRVTVDTRDDLQHVRELWFRAGLDQPQLTDLISAADHALAVSRFSRTSGSGAA